MLYAVDKRTGKSVYAGSLNVPRWGLVCPNPKCGAPVYLRAGGYRAPHFAHVRWGASDDCDLYHPFEGTGPGTTDIFPAPVVPAENRETSHLRQLALFIGTSTSLRASLHLRVPAADQGLRWSGEVRFSTPGGEARFRQEHLTVDRYVEVPPKVDRYVGRVVGDVDDLYGQLVQEGLNGISSDKSLFRTDGGFGHRLSWNEDVYWGDTLVVVCGAETSYDKFEAFAKSASLEYQPLALHPGFRCAEIHLPDEAEIQPHVRPLVAEYLDREIRPRRPQVLLLDPAPHHFSAEGEWVVASGTESIKLHRSQREVVTVTAIDGEEMQVQELSDDTVEFTVGVGAVYNARLGTNSINIRLSDCTFNSASTIRIGTPGEMHSIEKLATSTELCRRLTSSANNVHVEFSNSAFQGIFSINGDPWKGNDAFREVLRNESLGVVLRLDSYLTFVLRAPAKPLPVKAVDNEGSYIDADQSALQDYFLKYGSSLPGRVPADALDVGKMMATVRVSPGMLPQLRWLNRKGRQQ